MKQGLISKTYGYLGELARPDFLPKWPSEIGVISSRLAKMLALLVVFIPSLPEGQALGNEDRKTVLVITEPSGRSPSHVDSRFFQRFLEDASSVVDDEKAENLCVGSRMGDLEVCRLYGRAILEKVYKALGRQPDSFMTDTDSRYYDLESIVAFRFDFPSGKDPFKKPLRLVFIREPRVYKEFQRTLILPEADQSVFLKAVLAEDEDVNCFKTPDEVWVVLDAHIAASQKAVEVEVKNIQASLELGELFPRQSIPLKAFVPPYLYHGLRPDNLVERATVFGIENVYRLPDISETCFLRSNRELSAYWPNLLTLGNVASDFAMASTGKYNQAVIRNRKRENRVNIQTKVAAVASTVGLAGALNSACSSKCKSSLSSGKASGSQIGGQSGQGAAPSGGSGSGGQGSLTSQTAEAVQAAFVKGRRWGIAQQIWEDAAKRIVFFRVPEHVARERIERGRQGVKRVFERLKEKLQKSRKTEADIWSYDMHLQVSMSGYASGLDPSWADRVILDYFGPATRFPDMYRDAQGRPGKEPFEHQIQKYELFERWDLYRRWGKIVENAELSYDEKAGKLRDLAVGLPDRAIVDKWMDSTVWLRDGAYDGHTWPICNSLGALDTCAIRFWNTSPVEVGFLIFLTEAFGEAALVRSVGPAVETSSETWRLRKEDLASVQQLYNWVPDIYTKVMEELNWHTLN